MREQDQLHAEIEAALGGAGLSLLEFALSRPRGGVKVKAVVYSPKGTGTDECAKATRLMLPRIQMILGIQEADIEVSSPGIDRIFKSDRDWNAFVGKAVKVLMKGEDVWREGRLDEVSGGRAKIYSRGGRFEFEIAAAAKARLDSTKEGE